MDGMALDRLAPPRRARRFPLHTPATAAALALGVLVGCDARVDTDTDGPGDAAVRTGLADAAMAVGSVDAAIMIDAGIGPADAGSSATPDARPVGPKPPDGGSVAGAVDAGSMDAGMPDAGAVGMGPTGRMAGMLEGHNAARAEVMTTPALMPLTWSLELSAYAQEWADTLAKTCTMMHRPAATAQMTGYGENLAQFFRTGGGEVSTPQQALATWVGERKCWTYGTIQGTEVCDFDCLSREGIHTNGCGHYTAIVGRRASAVGCGLASCTDAKQGNARSEIWVCNFDKQGNILGTTPY
jgi:pathogenesis-related protein 1